MQQVSNLGSEVPLLPFHAFALRPPMGWNSWDCFGTSVTEEQVRAQAKYMATHLLEFGWEYVVVDIQWYAPSAQGHGYTPGTELCLDEHGRLWPAPNRFPSSRGGAGLGPLAEEIHRLGLKFGLHLMRGIPRQAVERDLHILDSPYRASQIADRVNVCPWNPDMYGVNMSHPGAQPYYDSVFALLAVWGVDFVKVDDIARPYQNRLPEIEAVRRAIDRTKRAIVLSLSPGETALEAAAHVERHANLFRISDDFWDNWQALREQFGRLSRWNAIRHAGVWPDADMLPLGLLKHGRHRCRLSQDEQITLMTLWSIARSPLMYGGDLTATDPFTESLLTNREVLFVNQFSEGNRPVFERDGLVAWIATDPESQDRFLALFNTRDPISLGPETAIAMAELVQGDMPMAKTLKAALVDSDRLVIMLDDGEQNREHPSVTLGEAWLELASGRRLPLFSLPRESESAWWGDPPSSSNLVLDGHPVADGLGGSVALHVTVKLPSDATEVRLTFGFSDAAATAPGTRLRCQLFAYRANVPNRPRQLPLRVTAEELGITGPFTARDLWTGQELGTFSGSFSRDLAFHAAALVRLSPSPS